MQRRLLIIDDQRSVCVSLSFLLETAGYKSLTAESGRAAIALLDSEAIDGAVIDVHMPGLNGFDTCIALQSRASVLGRSLRVWFMTGAFTSILERRCAELGGLAVLHKPFDIANVLARLDAAFAPGLPEPKPIMPTPSCVLVDDSAAGGAQR